MEGSKDSLWRLQMKFRLSFKTPDVMAQLDFDEVCQEAAKAVVDAYVEYDEYIRVEFDTVEGTATVVEL